MIESEYLHRDTMPEGNHTACGLAVVDVRWTTREADVKPTCPYCVGGERHPKAPEPAPEPEPEKPAKSRPSRARGPVTSRALYRCRCGDVVFEDKRLEHFEDTHLGAMFELLEESEKGRAA